MNSYGPGNSTLEEEFRAFDILPPVVRAAIREAVLPWGAMAAAEMLVAGTDPDELAAQIAFYDDVLVPMECAKAYGRQHPQAENRGEGP